MKTYLPRFTLRRALIAITFLALLLGWLRPDRATMSDRSQLHPTEERWYIQFRPLFYPDSIRIDRQVEPDGVRWFLDVKTPS